MPPDEQRDRLTSAAERIAAALEIIAASLERPGPQPNLVVARPPIAGEPHRSPVTMRPASGEITVLIRNVGDRDTAISRPTAKLGGVEVSGQILGNGGGTAEWVTIPASTDAGYVTALFRFRPADDKDPGLLLLRIPHSPGALPGDCVLEVELAPAGLVDGRFEWRVETSRVVLERHESA